ncbi:hypothetical protein [Saccharopolyspora gregorii]|uniref:Uncharacterized protein n=1 Tax=Saccharopolyspora gregorii TaxID=33914 RepID=A0ABP6RTN6_9PSEU|nr:hypothetical protein [Saccharopolyspora gregorii]
MADDDEDESRTGQPDSSNVPWVAIIGFAASAVTVLGFLGFQNVGEVRDWVASGPSTSAAPTFDHYAADTSESDDHPTTEESATTEASESAEETTAETTSGEEEPEFDPADLDDEDTDPTPFTSSALLVNSFTTDRGTTYELVSAGATPCGEATGTSEDVRRTLHSYRCSTAMSGVYLVDDDTAGENAQVLVSVQVIPFETAAAAGGARASINGNAHWDFGVWCPRSGIGQHACSTGYTDARRYGYQRTDHRYLIGVSAVYANLSPTRDADPWLIEAAAEGVSANGPRDDG